MNTNTPDERSQALRASPVDATSTIRVSLSRENTREQIGLFTSVLLSAAQEMRKRAFESRSGGIL